MRVLHVINSLQMGGAEVLLRNLVPSFKRFDVETEIYLLNSHHSPLEDELVSAGTPISHSEHAAVYRPDHVMALTAHLRSKSYDVIHVHLFPAQLWAALAVRRVGLRTPLVTTEHSTHNRRRKAWFRPLDRWMYRQYDAIACIGEATASAMTDWLPEVASKTMLVPNGIPLQRFRSAQPLSKGQVVGTADSPIILFTARFDTQKDHATVLRAMTGVPLAHLVLVGDGPLRQQMEAMSRTLGIAQRVHFLGRRQDVPQLIKMADVYVHSSHWEGFGIAAVESMAGGLPVVASRVPGLMDVVGDAGLLFEPGNHDQLSSILNTLLSDSQRRNELAKSGQLRAEEYSIERSAERYVAFYRRALSAPSNGK